VFERGRKKGVREGSTRSHLLQSGDGVQFNPWILWIGVGEKVSSSKKPSHYALLICWYMTTVLSDVPPCSLIEMYLSFGIRAQKTVGLFFKLTALTTSETSEIFENLPLAITAVVWCSNIKNTTPESGYQLIPILLTLMICHGLPLSIRADK
jgi:hypothetical protein